MPPLRDLIISLVGGFQPTGDLGCDVASFLIQRGCPKAAEHSQRVAAESARIAAIAGEDIARAEAAGWLHDISAVFPHSERAEIACRVGLDVLAEEYAFPMIAHQKLSAVLARELFGITDPGIVGAVGCHTTLQAVAGVLDKVLFIADKVEWDGHGVSPYRDGMLRALEFSLDAEARYYLHALWELREDLPVLHPWLAAAHSELCDCVAPNPRTSR